MKEELKPVDLGHLEDTALAARNAFEASHDSDRSEEYRAFHLAKAESLVDTLVRDFRYYFDKYKIGGIIPYGLGKPYID